MAGKRGFGHVRRLPSGRLQASYLGPDGQRRTAPDTFTTVKAADAWLAEVRADLQRGSWRRPELAAQRFDEYAVAWLRGRDDLKPRTRELYSSLMDHHLFPGFGLLQLRQIDPVTVRAWFASRGQSTGKTARARSYALLRTVLNQAVRDGAIVANPCTIRGGSQTTHPERVPATIAQVVGIAERMPPRYRMLILAGAWSGLRFGELNALRRRDVDLSGELPALRVERAAHRVGGRWITTEPKSAAGRRVVHLPPHLADDLREHLAVNVPRGPDALVFGTSTGNHLANPNMRAMFKRAAAGVGRQDLHFHDLRHTGATLVAQAGATTKELMTRMGHASPRASLIYQHASTARDRAIAEALSIAARGDNVIPLPIRSA